MIDRILFAVTVVGLVGALALFVGSSIVTAVRETEMARSECKAVSGHFVNQNGRECWSTDGTRRLFPSEKF